MLKKVYEGFCKLQIQVGCAHREFTSGPFGFIGGGGMILSKKKNVTIHEMIAAIKKRLYREINDLIFGIIIA